MHYTNADVLRFRLFDRPNVLVIYKRDVKMSHTSDLYTKIETNFENYVMLYP